MTRVGVLTMGIVGLVTAFPIGGVLGADDVPEEPSASAIYSRMVTAMRNLPDPGSLSYDVSFVPHGLTIALIQRDKAIRPVLLFSPATTPAVLGVHERPDGNVDVTDGSGNTYAGRSTFFAATWTSARSVSTRSAASVSASAQANDSASPAPDDGRPVSEDVTRRAVIGDVVTFSDRYYALERLPDADDTVYHLRLRARSDAVAHPLTDVYVDRQTGLPVRLDASFRNDAFISGYQGTMTMRFGSVDGRWIIVGGTVSAKAHFLVTHAGGTVDYHIVDVRFGVPASAPSPRAE
jgi:hypothetical protein